MPPVWQCRNQHVFCSSCLETFCNVCQETMANPTRNLIVEEIVKNSEELLCVYQTEGCDFLGRFVDLSHHQTTCEFADVPNLCVLKPCLQKLRKRPMIEHLLKHEKVHMSNLLIEDGKFALEVFQQASNEEAWKSFQWGPVIYKRKVDDEERAYLVQVWSEDWILHVGVFSITDPAEPIRYLLEMPKGKSLEDKGRYVMIGTTASYTKAPPAFTVPLVCALKNYAYLHTRGDIKVLQLQFHLPGKDFYNF